MILTATEIVKHIAFGHIVISPYHEDKVQPNGYDLHLAPTLLTPRISGFRPSFIDNEKTEIGLSSINCPTEIWDSAQPIEYDKHEIGDEGFVLMPNTLYIACTAEYTESHTVVPVIEGKSSIARMGVSIHQTAGLGEIGFCGTWTLEISVMYPTKVYKGMPIAQIIFYKPYGEFKTVYGEHGNHYQGQRMPTPTALHKNFKQKLIDIK